MFNINIEMSWNPTKSTILYCAW